MNVSCGECGSVFRVDPAKIPQAGIRARCSVCGGVIAIGEHGAIDEDFIAAPARRAPREPAVAEVPFAPPAPAPPRPATLPTPPMLSKARAAAASPAPKTSPAPPAPPQGEAAAPAAPARPAPRVPAPPVVPAAMPASPPVSPAPGARPPSSAAAPAPATRPPINPFLANDPNQKAKRLARALVSDIIAYFPDKHREGVQNGTLRELFRDEIKKSYEEYVEQMGKEFAESTTHFQDALNDVLAGGQRMF